ncbi:aminotransferase class I/II-fold pyridoxal phosphate-dependent enzyme, partial [archaeon]|nr:aminotransferase class I/II-fold pyridoxal phosphate-dependent enzyme [archaeon]
MIEKLSRLKDGLKFLMSERTKELPSSIFHELFDAAKTRPEVISLGPGEPDFTTPDYILEAVKENLHKLTHYGTPGGLPELKEAISKKLWNDNRIRVADPEKEVIVTAGSTEALLLAFLSIDDVTEEVLVPNPGFLAYTPMVELIDCQATSIPLHEEEGFQLNIDEVKKKISPKTTSIIVNSPSNP